MQIGIQAGLITYPRVLSERIQADH
jgi:hypothetical protein